MKRNFIITAVFIFVAVGILSAQSNKHWTEHSAKKWFKKREWLHGLSITPHASIDKVQFATQYHLNQTAWDKAFAYLKNTDLKTLAIGRHVIDGNDVFAIVTEAPT
ncbi:MAG TPA: YhcH/YjgK/YiaL family protein, partial [Flavisolibacter sp.]|nr:YhcH/YjgK/YiaL family protein [Flavisolibacter sp.]